tara:strand:+ start:168 stop:371 length:204 start_codon:yes stop_codon:yes gene_type:complete
MTGKKGSIQEANRGDRGGSLRHQMEMGRKREARKQAEKLMGKNYFTNMQEVMLRAAMELNERTKKNV